jgi:hypothetical protein
VIKINGEQALLKAAKNEEVYMAVCLSEETPVGEFIMADFYFAPEPEKPEPKEEPKKEANKATKKLDHGKICALRNAGWPVSKIADEMGCSGPTVRYHLDKEGIE